jgi:hypothetical protein
MLRHPTGTGEVTVIDGFGVCQVPLRVHVKDDGYCFPPVRAFRRCIKQAQVGNEVAFIVFRQAIAFGRAIVK